jgi:hypothetical protein
MSKIHVAYGYVPGAAEPIVMGFGKSDNVALRELKNKIDNMRSRPHDSLVIDAPLSIFFIRSNGSKVAAGSY